MTDTQFRDTRDAAIVLSNSLAALKKGGGYYADADAEMVKDALVYLLTQDAEQ